VLFGSPLPSKGEMNLFSLFVADVNFLLDIKVPKVHVRGEKR
jgi:hypothetical protein